jgi:hypothetical protein
MFRNTILALGLILSSLAAPVRADTLRDERPISREALYEADRLHSDLRSLEFSASQESYRDNDGFKRMAVQDIRDAVWASSDLRSSIQSYPNDRARAESLMSRVNSRIWRARGSVQSGRFSSRVTNDLWRAESTARRVESAIRR